MRQIRSQGSEIGIHTFTHPDLAEVSPWRVDREMTETQLALAGATGELSYLVRPPYSSEPSALDDQRFGVVSRLGTQGYVTALVDVDSRDWERPGAAAIAHNSVPEDGKGGVVLLHDAGGDRSQTVEALDQLIPQMQRDGFTFTTLSTGVGLPPANFPAGPVDRSTRADHARRRRDRRRARRRARVEPAARRRGGGAARPAGDGRGDPARAAAAPDPARET